MIKFPFTSMQQFNLDWIMQQLHKMLQFMPMNGVAGDVLQRNVDGAVWMPLTSVSLDIHSMSTIPEVEGADELAIYDNSLQGNYKGTVADILALVPASPVSSVNGQTGAVVLSIPSDTSDLTNTAGFVDAAGAAAAAPVQSVNGMTGAVTVPTFDIHFGGLSYLTATIDTSVDVNNDGTIDSYDVVIQTTSDKDIIRLCGQMKFTSGDNTGWRTFVITGADIADMPAGWNYVDMAYSCNLFKYDSEWKPVLYSSSSPSNYRIMDDKSIRIYVYVGAANTEYLVQIKPEPVQVA